jgi:hypothetical protein
MLFDKLRANGDSNSCELPRKDFYADGENKEVL